MSYNSNQDENIRDQNLTYNAYSFLSDTNDGDRNKISELCLINSSSDEDGNFLTINVQFV